MNTFIFKRVVAAMLIVVLLASCTMENTGPGKPDRSVIISESARLLEENLEKVVRELEAQGELEGFVSQGTLTGEEVARGLLEEENGEKYMDFLYYSSRFESVEDVVKMASGLVSSADLEKIVTEADKIEARLFDYAEQRALNDNQKAEFYKDIRKLVVKTVVLLTAALVYAAIPNTVFWGKITAATAVSVSAGIVASGFLRIIEHKNNDAEANSQTFYDWLKELSTDPVTSWAIAAGIINTGKSLGASPVTTSIILAIFAVYGIKDEIKPILEKYNFKV